MNDLETLPATSAFIARSIGYFDDLDLLDWARASPEIEALADDPDVFALLTTNNKDPRAVDRVHATLRQIVARHWPDFDLTTPESERIARRLFEAQLRAYVGSEAKPWAVCRMVGEIEPLYDFPDWLGDMYNACDWIDADYPRLVPCTVAQAVEAHLAALDQPDRD